MNKKIRAMVVAALAVASVFAFSTSAQAGTYNVNSNAAFGGYTWGVYPAGSWGLGVQGGGSYILLEMTRHGPVGQNMWWRSPQLPSTLNLDSIIYTTTWNNATTNVFPFSTRMCYNGFYSTGTAGSCAGNAIDTFPNRPDGNTWSSGSYVMDRGNACGINNAATSAPYHCAGFAFEMNGGYASGGAALSNIRGTVSDYVAPATTSQLATHTISQGNWMHGTVDIGATGNDTNGSGITSMSFYPGDPTKTISVSPGCSNGAWVPCSATYGWSGTFNTAGMSDGSHTAYYTSTDAGANTSQSTSFDYKSDNTNPTTPNNITPNTNGQNGWTSTNAVGASWTNGSEVAEDATHSGLDKVIVDVQPTTGGQTDPAPVTVPIGGSASGISATTTSISGLALPAAGAWTLRLQLMDKAGNVSDVGDGSGASVDSDISVGYDPNPPATPLGQANGWISRDELAAGYDQDFTYTSNPTSLAPLCGFASSVDENQSGTAGTTINVPGGATRKVRLDGTLTEATHFVHLRAVACSGLASPTTNTTEAKVDRTDPDGTITGVVNGHWYKDGKLVTLSATDALSGMSPADASDPLATDGAYLSYSLNGSGPLDKNSPRGDTADIPVTGEGEKTLSFQPVDLAGNKAAPKVATFGIDASKPTGYINRQDAAKPTLLSAPINDSVSGIDYAVFYVRLAGSSDAWKSIPTSLVDTNGATVGGNPTSATASARFPDTELPDGSYNVRVTAFDQAGNELDTDRYKDGSIATVANPMRDASKINAKLFKAVRSCSKKHCVVKKCTKKTKGTCYKVYKGKVTLVGGSTTVAVAFNRGAMINGVLSGADDKPLANQDVVISTVEKVSGKTATVGTTRTDSNGIYGIRVPAGLSRTVVATFPGTETRENVDVKTNMGSQAKLKLKISKRHAKTGQTVTFSGRVTSYDGSIPAAGKIVALQFYALKKWRPAVAVAHTDSKGRFKIKYKFDGKKVKAKIIFRVSAPAEDSWGHVASVSKPTVIRLN